MLDFFKDIMIFNYILIAKYNLNSRHQTQMHSFTGETFDSSLNNKIDIKLKPEILRRTL